MFGILTGSEDLIITFCEKYEYSQDWERKKNAFFCILLLVAYGVTILR